MHSITILAHSLSYCLNKCKTGEEGEQGPYNILSKSVNSSQVMR
jgi:hypothetical protein